MAARRLPWSRSLLLIVGLVRWLASSAHAAFPDGWAGYVTHSVTTEPASNLTDFTLLVSLDQLPSEFWLMVQSDGDDIRASKDAAGAQQLPVDIISFSDQGRTGSGLIAVKWTGTRSSSVNEPLYLWAGNPIAARPADTDAYGRENAYAAHVRAFWPHGGGEDRTQYDNDLAMQGSPAEVAGPINGSKATDYNGSTQWGVATASVPTSTPLVMLHHGRADVDAARMRALAVADTASDNEEYWDLEWRGDLTGDPIQAHAGNPYAAQSASGFSINQWHQAVGVFIDPDFRKAGIDGVLGSLHEDTNTISGVDSISVGALKQQSGRNPFDGKLSMAFLHTIVLPDAWIAYQKEMLDQPTQADFYGMWSWRGVAADALALGFRPNDPAAASANAVLLAEACKARRLIVWPAGDFYFGKINTTNIESFRQIAWKGAASEYAWQHQEEGTQGDKQLTRFVITGMNASDVWLDMSAHAATRIGPWRIEDITFQIPEIEGSPNIIHKGSLFRIGDPADVVPGGQSIRGLSVDDCYFTFEGHLSAGYLINPSEPASTDAGWYLNRPYGRNFAWQVTKGYDVALEDCSFRGWYVGGEFRHNDRFLARNWRGGANGRVIDVYAIPGAGAPVPAAIFGLWSEGHWVVGANLESCEVHGLNAESGYRGSYAPDVGEQDQAGDGVVPPGDADPYDDDPRRLVETVTWSMATGADKVKFPKNNIPPTVKLSDYFEPRTVVRFESSGQPPRYLYIEAIDDADPDGVHATLQFRNAATTSYIHAPMSGNGQQITRFFGTGVNLVGDKTAVFGHNVHVNYMLGDIDHQGNDAEAPGDFPLAFIVPGSVPMVVSGGVEGRTANSGDDSTRWAVVADCAGTQFNLCGGVRWIGPEAPDHPLTLVDGQPHLENDDNVRSLATTGLQVPRDTNGDGAIDYFATVYRAYPGRGVSQANTWARDLRFRTQNDAALGKRVWVHRLSDTTNGWVIIGLPGNSKPVDYAVRVFCTNSPTTLQVFGGVGSDSIPISGLGWRTIYGQLDAAQVDTDGEVWLSGANLEVAWVELLREEQ